MEWLTNPIPTILVMFSLIASVAILSGLGVHAQSYTATYLPSTAPDHTENGQLGTNKCGTDSAQTSMCQNSYCGCSANFLHLQSSQIF
jgi:hypothetical protein